MRTNQANLSNIRNLLILLSVLFLAAVIAYHSFLGKSKSIELYDELNMRLSSLRVSITKLEYLLDMFVVAGRFEPGNIDMIKEDVEKLDANINEIVSSPKFIKLLKDEGLLSEDVTSMSDDWRIIKAEIARLNSALSRDESMLIHNAVDMNTVLITEKAERLLGGAADARQKVFREAKGLVFKSIAASIVFALFCALLFYKRFLSPIGRAASVAMRISSGETDAKFDEARGSMGTLGAGLNAMLGSTASAIAQMEDRISGMEAELNGKTRQFESLNIVLTCAGRSLSHNELFGAVVKEVVSSGGAGLCAIYMVEEGVLRLKASVGFDGVVSKDLESADVPRMRAAGALDSMRLFKNIGEYPDTVLSSSLASCGMTSLITAPIAYNNECTGLLLAAYKGAKSFAEGSMFFMESLAAAIGASTGHVNLFQNEVAARRFLERVINQMPPGVAVFGPDGGCRLANHQLKRMFGADPKYDFHSRYRIFEDDVFISQGMIPYVKKTFEGFVSEFSVNYEPALMLRHGFIGQARKLSVRTHPVYDAGGEISNILLICEETKDAAAATGGGGSLK